MAGAQRTFAPDLCIENMQADQRGAFGAEILSFSSGTHGAGTDVIPQDRLQRRAEDGFSDAALRPPAYGCSATIRMNVRDNLGEC